VSHYVAKTEEKSRNDDMSRTLNECTKYLKTISEFLQQQKCFYLASVLMDIHAVMNWDWFNKERQRLRSRRNQLLKMVSSSSTCSPCGEKSKSFLGTKSPGVQSVQSPIDPLTPNSQSSESSSPGGILNQTPTSLPEGGGGQQQCLSLQSTKRFLLRLDPMFICFESRDYAQHLRRTYVSSEDIARYKLPILTEKVTTMRIRELYDDGMKVLAAAAPYEKSQKQKSQKQKSQKQKSQKQKSQKQRKD
jgi:hypothetical protein